MHCDHDLWPFDLKIYRTHAWLIGCLHEKFHDDRCKGKAVMRRKPFSVIYALWPWPLTFWPSKSIGHILDSWGVCMLSFMIIGEKGKQLCAGNPNAPDRRTEGRTDRRTDMVIPEYPPNFVAGDIMNYVPVYTMIFPTLPLQLMVRRKLHPPIGSSRFKADMKVIYHWKRQPYFF